MKHLLLLLLAPLTAVWSAADTPAKPNTVLVLSGPRTADAPPDIQRPDDRPASHSKKVKVFILMGQSNMVGMGDIEPEGTSGTLTTLVKREKKYPWVVDEAGHWTVRKDVYYYDARVKKGGPLTATSNGRSIGPELGFGFVMGQVLDEPVLVLKSCIGNRSLGWDLLPPGSERYQAEVTERGGTKVTKVFAGYKDKPDSWPMDPVKKLATEPPPWLDKKTGKPIEWYAGKQYDDDMANAKAALENLAKIYPDYKGQGYEIAGFVWWQGHKDQNPVHAAHYEQNLKRLIPTLRKDYNAPNAKLVLATGCGNPGRESFGLQIAEAQLAIADAKKHPEFAGNVKAVDNRDLWREADVSPKNQGYHYNRNAETYLETGLRLGWAMAELLKPMN
jgi:alpha-galactosidase